MNNSTGLTKKLHGFFAIHLVFYELLYLLYLRGYVANVLEKRASKTYSRAADKFYFFSAALELSFSNLKIILDIEVWTNRVHKFVQ
jgi:hypothetical protein